MPLDHENLGLAHWMECPRTETKPTLLAQLHTVELCQASHKLLQLNGSLVGKLVSIVKKDMQGHRIVAQHHGVTIVISAGPNIVQTMLVVNFLPVLNNFIVDTQRLFDIEFLFHNLAPVLNLRAPIAYLYEKPVGIAKHRKKL